MIHVSEVCKQVFAEMVGDHEEASRIARAIAEQERQQTEELRARIRRKSFRVIHGDKRDDD